MSSALAVLNRRGEVEENETTVSLMLLDVDTSTIPNSQI